MPFVPHVDYVVEYGGAYILTYLKPNYDQLESNRERERERRNWPRFSVGPSCCWLDQVDNTVSDLGGEIRVFKHQKSSAKEHTEAPQLWLSRHGKSVFLEKMLDGRANI